MYIIASAHVYNMYNHHFVPLVNYALSLLSLDKHDDFTYRFIYNNIE